MQYRIASFIFVLMLIPQIMFAASPSITNLPEAVPAAQLPLLKGDKAPVIGTDVSSIEITNVRYAVHNDAVSGDSKLRLVMDVSGPVQADAVIKDLPVPRLVVSVKGAGLGKIKSAQALDGKIAEQVSFSSAEGSSMLIIDLPNMIDDTDYRVFTLPSDVKADKPYRVVIDINKPTPPVDLNFTAGLKGKVIALDPGHGGSDPGAIGQGGAKEKTVTLAVAQKLQTLLEKAGAKVVMTRRDDRDVYGPNATAVDELKARIITAATNKADIFVSIHADSFTNPTAGGTSTYYYRKSLYDVMLAQNVQASIIKAGGLTNRNANPANFYVIKRSTMPATLVELAFISNPDEEKLLISPQFQQRMAQGIYEGLDSFFSLAAKRGGGQ